MPYGANYHRYTPRQLDGSEYGGVQQPTRNTIQPKGGEALSAGEILRLGYLTGQEHDPLQLTITSLEDRRQALGLKPAGDVRPTWLSGTGRPTEAEIQGAEYPEQLYDMDMTPPDDGGF